MYWECDYGTPSSWRLLEGIFYFHISFCNISYLHSFQMLTNLSQTTLYSIALISK